MAHKSLLTNEIDECTIMNNIKLILTAITINAGYFMMLLYS